MATNFEFYLPKMRKAFRKTESASSICDMMFPTDYVGDCSKDCRDCIADFIEYLATEHIEQPKLTKRERAFCEAVQMGWIARDCNMHLFYFSGKPELKQGIWMTHVGQYCRIKGIEDAFMFIKDTDAEPWAVEDLLKLEVIEEVQHEED